MRTENLLIYDYVTMLHVFRKNPYTLTKRVMLAMLGVVLTFFFGAVGYFARVKPIASVGCRSILGVVTLPGCYSIYPNDLDQEVTNLRKVMINRYGDEAPKIMQGVNLRQMAVEQLIEQQLVANEAHRLGLNISDEDLARAIESQTAFQVDGHFSVERYNEILRNNGVETAEFENETRQEVLTDTLREMVANAVEVSTEEARQEFNRFGEKLSLAYIEFAYSNFTAGIQPTDKEIAKLYQDDKESFREPERVRIAYVRYDPSALMESAPPADADIQKFYEDNLKTLFTHPEQVRAQHILIATGPDADAQQKAAAKAKAEDILKKLKAGGDFSKLAAQFSDDPGTRDKGGDLGYFSRGEMVKPFEDAAFQMKPGQMQIVESQFGYHIIRVEDIKLPHIDSPGEARAKIIDELKNKAGTDAARQDVDQDLSAALIGRDLNDIAKKRGLVAVETPYFAQDETIKGAEDNPKLVQTVFALQPGDIRAVTNGPVPYLVKLIDRKASRIPPLSEIKDKVRDRLIRVTAETKAYQAAGAALKQMKSASDFDAVAAMQHFQVRMTGEFVRATRSVPDIGEFPEVTEAAATIAKVPGMIDQVMENGGNSFIFKVVSRTPPSDDEWKRQGPTFTEQMLQRQRATAWQNFVNDLKKKALIVVHTDQLGETPASEPM